MNKMMMKKALKIVEELGKDTEKIEKKEMSMSIPLYQLAHLKIWIKIHHKLRKTEKVNG